MTTTTQKKRIIKYLNRDFDSLKKDLIEHLRVYFPDTIQDFNEASTAMLFTEIAAFVGDNMSFYLDKKVNESFSSTARELKNIFKHAKQLGYKPFGKSAAIGFVDGFIIVPATSSQGSIIADMRYAGKALKGAKLRSNAGEPYETLLDTDFSTIDPLDVDLSQPYGTDNATGVPFSFVLKKKDIPVKAGETKTTTFSVTTYEAFKTLTLPDEDVLEVLSVTDSEGNNWYEVDYLAQDTVFDSSVNSGGDSSDVPYVLKLRSVPFRFETEFDIDTNKTSLIFGSGDADTFDGELIPNLGDLSLPLYGKDTFTDFSIDPQNFLKTRTLGLAPVNTILTVKYRVGGGKNTNAGAGEVRNVSELSFDVADSTLDSAVIRDVRNSFSVSNPKPIQGGREVLSADVLKRFISANFASQGRTVTDADFIVRSLSMPSKFGSVFRANTKPSALNKSSVELIILSRDSNGYVSVAPQSLKSNLKKYLNRFRMTTDAIEILDGEIINIAIDFAILSKPNATNNEVLANCIEVLKEYFDVDKWQLNQPINLTSINCILADVPGVMSISKLDIYNRVGNYDSRSYSNSRLNIKENSKNGIIYSRENAIFEVKFPNKDIIGVVK